VIYPPLAERKPRAGARGWRCRWMGGGELLLANELLQRRQSGFEVGTELAQRVLAASADRNVPGRDVEDLFDELERAAAGSPGHWPLTLF
jgi:hypothetical protein